jgi:uncharacterized membrane protein
MNSNGLLAAGALILAVGVVLIVVATAGNESGSAGGFVLIGPLPIVFGTGTSGGELAILSLLAGVLMIALLVVAASRLASLIHKGDEESDK